MKVIKHISNTWAPLRHYYTFRLCLHDQIQACLETFLSTGLRTSVLVESFAWHEFGLSQTALYPNNSWALFGVLRIKWLWWPFPPGRPPGTSSFGDWKQLFSTDKGHPSSFRPKNSLRPSSFTGAHIARRTSTRNRRNWYFSMPHAVLKGYFGNKKTQHLFSWIRNICFSVIFIISGTIPN